MSPRSKTSETLPPELLRPGSRQVRLTAGGRFLTILAVIFLVGALVGGALLYVAATRDRPASAVVEEVTRSAKEPRVVVRYRYTVNGRDYSGERRLTGRARRSVTAGSEIPIRYAAKDPARSWIGAAAAAPVWLGPFLAGSLSAGAIIMLLAIRREWILLSEGRAATGRVIASKRVRKGGGHSSHTEFRLTVEFRVLSGALRTGRFDRRKEVPPGGKVTVVYDRDDPARSRLYPFALVRPRVG